MIAKRVPDRRLRFDPRERRFTEPVRRFYRRETEEVARDLLGAWFARRWRGQWYGGRIVETEAYLGLPDAAAHSWQGRHTARVEPMYREGGHLYVFAIYGMYHCANVVTREAGNPQAVLLRACEGPDGAPERLLSGPGKLCAALAVTRRDSGEDLVTGDRFAVFRSIRARPPRIGVSPRIGVDYAGDAAAWPLRFFDLDSRAVSVRKKSRIVSGES